MLSGGGLPGMATTRSAGELVGISVGPGETGGERGDGGGELFEMDAGDAVELFGEDAADGGLVLFRADVRLREERVLHRSAAHHQSDRGEQRSRSRDHSVARVDLPEVTRILSVWRLPETPH